MKKWKIILGMVAAAGLAAALMVYFFIYNKPHRDFERTEPDFVISAEELYNAFVDDEAAAAKFIGKVMLTDGEVATVEQVDEMVIVSFVFEEGMFGGEGVRCTMLASQHDDALQLSPGDKISVKGYCTGFTGIDVILEHCSLDCIIHKK